MLGFFCFVSTSISVSSSVCGILVSILVWTGLRILWCCRLAFFGSDLVEFLRGLAFFGLNITDREK